MEKIIYKSGNNEIIEKKEFFEFRDRNGNRAIFDKEHKIVDQIKKMLQGRRSFSYNKKENIFYYNSYINCKVKYYCNLRQLIIASLMEGDFDKNLKIVKGYAIYLVDSEKYWDLRSSNLDYTGENGKVNIFYSTNQYFIVKHQESGFMVKTDINEELNEALKCYRWHYDPKYNRLVTFLGGYGNELVSIHQFIKFFYDMPDKNTNVDMWILAMKRVGKRLQLSVDHLDSDRTNCCSANLVLMTRGENSRKSNLTKKLNTRPFICIPRLMYGNIDMKAGYHQDGKTILILRNFDSTEEFVQALVDFWKKGIIRDNTGIVYHLPQIPAKYFDSKK